MPRQLTCFLIILLSITLAILLSESRWAESVDSYSYDMLLKYVPHTSTETPEIAIIAIDDDSLNQIKDPLVHWTGYFATIVDALTTAGAKAIMFDVIPAISLEKFAPELDIRFMRAIRNAKGSGVPVFLGFKAGTIGGQMPHPKFSFLATNLGYLNIYPDNDGKVRKQHIWFADEKGRITPSLSLLAALTYTGETNIQLETSCKKFNICNENPKRASVRIDYRINQATDNLYSLSKVLNDSKDDNNQDLKNYFSDKVVFIGPLSERLPDNHKVPMNPLNSDKEYAPGLLIHTQTMLSILSPFHFKEASFQFCVGVTILISSLVSILIFILSPRRLLIFLPLIFVCGGFLVTIAFSYYFIVPMSSFIFGFIASTAVSGAYLYAIEYRQYRTLKKYFGSYVSPLVMEEIIENPESVHFEGNMVNISIMFTDIRNFTTLSERIKAPDVLHGLNTYLTQMTNSIILSEGYVNRYLGDGILALFGAPNTLPDKGALAAVKCGLDMQKRLNELNENQIFPGLDEIKIGIGIHTGEVIVGNVGCFEKMDYTVVGDSANLASRIEGLTKTYEATLLISESTYEIVKDHVNARYVDCVKVKGREEEVKIFKVLCLKEEEEK